MKLGVIIERSTQYRGLAPVIDEGLRRGWDVECWHNYGHAQHGAKAYLFPSDEAAPAFRAGAPAIRRYRDPDELSQLVTQRGADAILSVNAPSRHLPARRAGDGSPWIMLQHFSDLFMVSRPAGLLSADVLATYTDWWIGWGAELFAAQGAIADRDAFARQLRERAWPVGYTVPEQRRLVDPEAVRARLSIPVGKPIVVLLNFAGAMSPTCWTSEVFLRSNPLRQLAGIARRGRLDYLPHVLRGWSDLAVMRAVRAFCDRAGAHLIIKARLKTPIPAHARRLADTWLYDDSFYPATMIELLGVATAAISFYSSAALEMAALGVPHLCLTFPAADYCDAADRDRLVYFDRYFNREPGGLFEFPGVTTTMSIPEAITRLPKLPLDALRIDRAARARYLEKFVGPDDDSASARLMDRIAACVDGGRHDDPIASAARAGEGAG